MSVETRTAGSIENSVLPSVIEVSKNDLAVNGINWDAILIAFMADNTTRLNSAHQYEKQIGYFFKWCKESAKDLSLLEYSDIVAYMRYLESRLKGNTVESYLCAVRRFYKWTEKRKLYPNIADGIKADNREEYFTKDHLTNSQSRELISFYDNGNNLRNQAMIELMLKAGLRTIEVTRLKISDYNRAFGKQYINVWGKGHNEESKKFHPVPVTDKTAKLIEAYLATRKGADKEDYLFVSESRQNKGNQLTTRTIRSICRTALVGIGLNDEAHTAHSLRHTFAVMMLKNGQSLHDTQLLLRHKNPVTTQRYQKSIEREYIIEKAANSCLDEIF